jgi:hypothetical protein
LSGILLQERFPTGGNDNYATIVMTLCLETQILICQNLGYLHVENDLLNRAEAIKKMLNGLINNVKARKD